jgi:signal transduction histidine kinase
MAPAYPLRRYLGAMNLTAFFTWVVLMVLLFASPPRFFLSSRVEAAAGLMAFLAVFILKQRHEDSARLSVTCALVFALEGALALVTIVFWAPFGYAPILLIMFMADCAMLLSPRALLLVGIGINAGFYAIAAGIWHMQEIWGSMLAYLTFQLFATLTAWYARRAHETAAQLRETNAHLLATRSLLEESARDHERLRLARELHDVAGHKLTALKLNLTVLQREAGGGPTVDAAAQLATELLADIRGVVAQMRQHDGLDIREALRQLIAPLPAPPRIHLEIRDDARVASVAQAEALLRVVQEALTNVVRHSQAGNVWVSLTREGERLHLAVRDDGQAELPLREGFGLSGMRERLAQLSGRLEISRATQGGLSLDVQLPVQS